MRPNDEARAQELTARLVKFSQEKRALSGIGTEMRLNSLVRQMIDSIHRVEYILVLRERPIAPERIDPHHDLFDPLKAALLHFKAGNIDEAGWLVFLSTHFGFHRQLRWQATRMVYGALGGEPWTWLRTSTNLGGFRAWFEQNAVELSAIRFGNHRKYESVRVDVKENLADVVESYVSWVGANRGHAHLINENFEAANGDPRSTFEMLFNGMNVQRFGRTGRFDYLTMMGKLGIWDIDPPHPYFGAATGPVRGASLLFTNNTNETLSRAVLSQFVVELGDYLRVNMQVMEDSLCNWQKSPDQYLPFRG
ncbi:MAG: hypothetical protein LCH38_15185 [Proteobacteria bacterium]|nr:hypothetical protein [Pseudomonadota bacterium]